MMTLHEKRNAARARGQEVRSMRKHLDLTQADLATFMNVQVGQVSRLEGARFRCDTRMWVKMTDLYTATMDALCKISDSHQSANPITKNSIRTPEATSDDDLYGTQASGDCAVIAPTPPGATPALFSSHPSPSFIPRGGVSEGGRAGQASAPTHGPRGLPFPRVMKPYWSGWLEFLTDWIGVLSLFGTLFILLILGDAIK